MLLNNFFIHFKLLPVVPLLAVMGLSCSARKQEHVAHEHFHVAKPIIKDTSYVNEYVASIHSVQDVELRAKVSGYLDRIYVDEGETVKKGQLLFSVSGAEYREQLSEARARLKSAIADSRSSEVDLQNVKRLVEKKIVSQTELDVAQSKYDACVARIEEAKAHQSAASLRLAYADLRAPFDGVINRIPNKIGSLISEGDLLTTVSDNKEIFAYFNVSEKEYLDHVLSDTDDRKDHVELILANGKLYSEGGVIETVEGRIDRNTGNIAFRARFGNPKGIIKHGSSGKILLSKSLPNAMLIPQKSTFEIQDNLYVYTVDDQDIVHQQKISTSLRLPHLFVVSQGLSPEDRILYEGLQKVKEGDKITPEPVPLSQIHNR